MSDENYENWLTVDKVIAIIKRLHFYWTTVYMRERDRALSRGQTSANARLFWIFPKITGAILCIILPKFPVSFIKLCR